MFLHSISPKSIAAEREKREAGYLRGFEKQKPRSRRLYERREMGGRKRPEKKGGKGCLILKEIR